jgi:preprotein translocase subunit SecG
MMTGLIVLHVIVCVLLTVIVLLQFGKGAEAGAMMGSTAGASQNVFAASSRGNFFTKLTTFLAITFLVNSVALTIIKSKEADKSIFDGETPIAAPLNSDALEEKNATKEEPTTTTTIDPAASTDASTN